MPMTSQNIAPSNHLSQDIHSRTCLKCGSVFPLTPEFWNRDITAKQGFSPRCKKCKAQYYKDNKARINRKNSDNYQKNKEYIAKKRLENADAIKLKMSKYYNKNRKKIIKTNTEYYEKNKIKILQHKAKYRKDNKDTILKNSIKYREKNKEKTAIRNIENINSPVRYGTYSHKFTGIEETRKSIKFPTLLEVRCAYCGKWVVPMLKQVKNRLAAINGTGSGEGRFYCPGDQCRSQCSIYNQRKYPKRYKKATSREANPMLRQMVMERDNWTCQKCGITDVSLHCHHVVPATQNPMTANDPDVCMTLCKACHKLVHEIPGCGYYELRCRTNENQKTEIA